MGIDLRLVPEPHQPSDLLLGLTSFYLDRNSNLFDVIRALPINRFSSKFQFWKYGDEGLEKRSRDAYDEPLTFLYASDFLGFPAEFNEDEELSDWNAATLAFIRRLPPDTRILLYWC